MHEALSKEFYVQMAGGMRGGDCKQGGQKGNKVLFPKCA